MDSEKLFPLSLQKTTRSCHIMPNSGFRKTHRLNPVPGRCREYVRFHRKPVNKPWHLVATSQASQMQGLTTDFQLIASPLLLISKDGKNGDVDWKGRFNIPYHLILIIQDVWIKDLQM